MSDARLVPRSRSRYAALYWVSVPERPSGRDARPTVQGRARPPSRPLSRRVRPGPVSARIRRRTGVLSSSTGAVSELRAPWCEWSRRSDPPIPERGRDAGAALVGARPLTISRATAASPATRAEHHRLAAGRQDQSPGQARRRFTTLRCFFPAIRCSRDVRVGRVARRGVGRISAAVISSRTLARASSRF